MEINLTKLVNHPLSGQILTAKVIEQLQEMGFEISHPLSSLN